MRNQSIMFIMGAVHAQDNDLTWLGYGLQPTPLGANSIRNSRISIGCQFTPPDFYGLRLFWTVLQHRAIMKTDLLKWINFPPPSVSYMFIRMFRIISSWVSRYRFTGKQEYNIRSTISRRCGIQEVAPITRTCDVALCSTCYTKTITGVSCIGIQ